MTAQELEQMAARIEISRSLMPTHPHPMVPEALRQSKVAGSLLGVFDRMRDLFNENAKNERNL